MVRPINEITALSALVRTDFFYFVWKCFNTIVQEAQFVANWHIKAVAHELMRAQRGETTRLIINQPPRSLKSICVSVAFVAWLLGHDPRRRIIVVSYSNELAAELHRQFRMVIESEWYKQAFPMMRLAKDAGLEAVTTVGGGRYATSVEGTLTGRGANLIIIDDPQKADEAQSEKARAQVLNWFRGTLLSRLDDKRFGQIILVMQRLHQDDLSGDLLVTGDWCHLNLPAVALEDRTIQIGDNKFIRWLRGEPLQPEREGLEVLDRIKRTIGSQKYSAQFLQQPVPEGGNAIQSEKKGRLLPVGRISGPPRLSRPAPQNSKPSARVWCGYRPHRKSWDRPLTFARIGQRSSERNGPPHWNRASRRQEGPLGRAVSEDRGGARLSANGGRLASRFSFRNTRLSQ